MVIVNALKTLCNEQVPAGYRKVIFDRPLQAGKA